MADPVPILPGQQGVSLLSSLNAGFDFLRGLGGGAIPETPTAFELIVDIGSVDGVIQRNEANDAFEVLWKNYGAPFAMIPALTPLSGTVSIDLDQPTEGELAADSQATWYPVLCEADTLITLPAANGAGASYRMVVLERVDSAAHLCELSIPGLVGLWTLYPGESVVVASTGGDTYDWRLLAANRQGRRDKDLTSVAYTLASQDWFVRVITDATSGVLLPDSGLEAFQGREYRIHNTTGGACGVDLAGSNELNGGTSAFSIASYATMCLHTDGTDWFASTIPASS